MGARDLGEGEGELVFNECGVSVLQDEKILNMDGGEGCATI